VAHEAFRVRFANGQESFCSSVDEARRIIRRRWDQEPPPGILPAVIAQVDESDPSGFRVIESYPVDE
jgi:hypothetical protein